MGRPTIDITGKKFGLLTAVCLHEKIGRRSMWLCTCECGGQTVVLKSSLGNSTNSCGCLPKGRKTVHGRSSEPEYKNWSHMIDRCTNKLSAGWPRYGGRGISVCDRWLNGDGTKGGYECFFEDMGQRPTPDHSIDRINNNGDYCPLNCRWSLPKQQSNNTRRNVFIEYAGERLTMTEWSEKTGIPVGTLWHRIHHGWTTHAALTTPVDPANAGNSARFRAFDTTKRRRLTPQERARLFQLRGGRCHSCQRKLGPADKWIVEHVIALTNAGTNDVSNLDITCEWCKPKKDAEDHAKAAKTRSVATKHVVPKSERKKSGFNGWRKFDGSIVWRK